MTEAADGTETFDGADRPRYAGLAGSGAVDGSCKPVFGEVGSGGRDEEGLLRSP
jgi:hypothetical protein